MFVYLASQNGVPRQANLQISLFLAVMMVVENSRWKIKVPVSARGLLHTPLSDTRQEVERGRSKQELNSF